MGNIQWGPCGGKKRKKSSSQRNGLPSTGQRKSDSEILEAAASTGYGSYGGYGGLSSLSYGLDCPEGIDEDLALLATAATLAGAVWVLYRQIVIQTGRRRKRSTENSENGNSRNEILFSNPFLSRMKPIFKGNYLQQTKGIRLIDGSPIGTNIISGTKIRGLMIFAH